MNTKITKKNLKHIWTDDTPINVEPRQQREKSAKWYTTTEYVQQNNHDNDNNKHFACIRNVDDLSLLNPISPIFHPIESNTYIQHHI